MSKSSKIAVIVFGLTVIVASSMVVLFVPKMEPGEDRAGVLASSRNGRGAVVGVIQENILPGYGFSNFVVHKEGKTVYLRTDLPNAGAPLLPTDTWGKVLDQVGKDYPNNIVSVSVLDSGNIELRVLAEYAQGKMYVLAQKFPVALCLRKFPKSLTRDCL